MALARCSTKRAIYVMTAAVFLILAIMSSTSTSCQGHDDQPQAPWHRRLPSPPLLQLPGWPKKKFTCYPYNNVYCLTHDCAMMCGANGFDGYLARCVG
ncbi:unnamed protein product [Urochloa decumbens]|uniref:Uncharacterized protein n=1 Tax=Urochloa decumbens TaxID=240449 RepID=A0ABC9AP78_9POAL